MPSARGRQKVISHWFFQKVVVTKRCGLDEGLPVSPEKIAFSRALLDVA
jgi:hypothetical protein